MKINLWVRNFIYITSIVLLIYIHYFIFKPYDFDKDYFFSHNILYFVFTPLFFVLCGTIIGFDHFIIERQKKGKWHIKWPQILIILPSFYFAFSLLLREIYLPLFQITQIIIRNTGGSGIFIKAFQMILGYEIITCLYKKEK